MGAALTTIISIALGVSGLATGAFAVFTQVRDRKRSIRKQEIQIDLDETTRERLASEAAQINSDARIATERWWKEQFDAVKDELIEEQRLRRELTRESHAVKKWASQHQTWDERAWERARQTDPDFPRPPRLELEEE